ncbi:MAG: aminoacyl-tRNA hydrolase [Clostridia bacterium]|nr:aminoacyl-tRNA hydrolase [Clostridia bacterium]
MYLIVGLGNPEEEYANTRHNMGFDVINKISKNYNIEVAKTKFEGLYGKGEIEGEKVILLKPQTYMNLSGHAVRKFVDFFKIEPENVVVIFDDIDIEKGQIKIRKLGSGGSHKGMQSVIQMMGTEKIPRIRVGIGSPENKKEMIEYVISKIKKEEKELLEPGIEKAGEAVKTIIKEGLDKAMNKFNSK